MLQKLGGGKNPPIPLPRNSPEMGHVVAVFVYTLINQNSKYDVPMHVCKNMRTGVIVLLPSVNTLRF